MLLGFSMVVWLGREREGGVVAGKGTLPNLERDFSHAFQSHRWRHKRTDGG